ncbi:MAG: ATP synthase subunit I [Actinomycetota bacterium]|nr:ATP synthase subunit I [Actinomycetota bacterium]
MTAPTPVDTPAVEREVVVDMVRRAAPVLPVVILVAGLARGADGAYSAAFAVAVVVGNFLLAAALVGWAARISPVVMATAAMGGFVGRLVVVTVAFLLVKDQAWVDVATFGFTLILTHLGLLIWETRHISASLAFPGVKPARARGL